jgi:hypothetical protein
VDGAPCDRGFRNGELATVERVRRLVAICSSALWVSDALRFVGISVRRAGL